MPKYLVTSGSHFTPFTYDELVKPVAHMQQVHDAAQDAYDQLNLETSALRRYISDNPADSQAKAMYDNYMDKLTTLQNNLWNNGVNAQTRRDLAAARGAYASDITRLATAVKNRQERSKEYWDMRHKNPDLIMGDDPGLGGLNDYLANENFGQNYFTYSGEQFMKEVGTDAKARAAELQRDPRVERDPDLNWMLTRIQQEGFTSSEVSNANAAVRAALSGDDGALAGLDQPSRILADVLMSHINATGAQRGVNVSNEEFNRLIGYGSAGLAQAIGKEERKDFNDPYVAQQMELDTYRKKLAMQTAAANAKAAAKKKEEGAGRPYSLNDIATYMRTKDADRITKELDQKFHDPFRNPAMITGTDGRPDVIANADDARRILSSLGRDTFIQKYGFQPENATSGKVQTVRDASGRPTRMKISLGYSGSGDKAGDSTAPRKLVVQTQDSKGKWTVNNDLSERMSADYAAYIQKLNAWKANNPGVKIEKLAVVGKDFDKMAERYGIPKDASLDEAYAIMQTKGAQGYVTPATIADSTMEKTLEKFEGLIYNAYARGTHGEKPSRTSDYTFYETDGFEIADKANRKEGRTIDTVLPKKGSLTGISVYPEDLLKNRVRISTTSGKEYAIAPSLLGNNMDVQIQRLRPVVAEAMKPIFDPVSALRMSTDDTIAWIDYASQLLGDYMPFDKRDANGQFLGFITPEEIVYNPQLQEMLRTAVTRFMNNVLAEPRDQMDLNPHQVRGATSEKAVGYNDYLYYDE